MINEYIKNKLPTDFREEFFMCRHMDGRLFVSHLLIFIYLITVP